jgi:hypothetical protein
MASFNGRQSSVAGPLGGGEVQTIEIDARLQRMWWTAGEPAERCRPDKAPRSTGRAAASGGRAIDRRSGAAEQHALNAGGQRRESPADRSLVVPASNTIAGPMQASSGTASAWRSRLEVRGRVHVRAGVCSSSGG